MRKKLVLLVLALAAVVGAEAGLFTAVSNAASCYQVDCNICCPTSNGKVICTERACV